MPLGAGGRGPPLPFALATPFTEGSGGLATTLEAAVSVTIVKVVDVVAGAEVATGPDADDGAELDAVAADADTAGADGGGPAAAEPEAAAVPGFDSSASTCNRKVQGQSRQEVVQDADPPRFSRLPTKNKGKTPFCRNPSASSQPYLRWRQRGRRVAWPVAPHQARHLALRLLRVLAVALHAQPALAGRRQRQPGRHLRRVLLLQLLPSLKEALALLQHQHCH